MSDTLLQIRNVRKWFNSQEKRLMVIDGVSFDVREGEFISILGPSGCGKTTLLRIIAGLEKQDEGEILLRRKNITGPGQDRAMVFQDYALFPWRTVLGNVLFGLEIRKIPKKEALERAKTFIKLVGLEGFENSYPHELSGGMRQRVALARALVCEPDILLMDEPLSALDAQTRNLMQTELVRIWEETKKTIIYVTHSIEEAVYLSDRIALLSKRPAKLLDLVDVDLVRPRDRFSKDFVDLRARIFKLIQG
ncbi:MAG: ABC transporter ATP-binding protein [Archaeoglobaceae archaeon]|nr:ABC transporter ATP-binding protein [Archaeoglobaceae archaeon]MDW8118440.1 ABC transporter ATP-binding protein [Archaeoglobaceae archaeon]